MASRFMESSWSLAVSQLDGYTDGILPWWQTTLNCFKGSPVFYFCSQRNRYFLKSLWYWCCFDDSLVDLNVEWQGSVFKSLITGECGASFSSIVLDNGLDEKSPRTWSMFHLAKFCQYQWVTSLRRWCMRSIISINVTYGVTKRENLWIHTISWVRGSTTSSGSIAKPFSNTTNSIAAT